MGTKTKMSEPSIVSSPFKDNDLSLLVLIFLFNYLQNTMSHNLHGNISIKCLEIKKRFNFRLGPGLWRTKPDLFSDGGLNPGQLKTRCVPCVPAYRATLFTSRFIWIFSLLVHCFKYTRIGPPLWWTASTHEKKQHLINTNHTSCLSLTRSLCHNCAVFKRKPVEQINKPGPNQSFPPPNTLIST